MRLASRCERQVRRSRAGCAAVLPGCHALKDWPVLKTRAIAAIPLLGERIAPESAFPSTVTTHVRQSSVSGVRSVAHTAVASVFRTTSPAPRISASVKRAIRRRAVPASTAAMRAAASAWVLVRYARTSTANPPRRESRVVPASAGQENIAATRAAASVRRLAAGASSSSVVRPVSQALHAARRSVRRGRSVVMKAAASARHRTATASRSPVWTSQQTPRQSGVWKPTSREDASLQRPPFRYPCLPEWPTG